MSDQFTEGLRKAAKIIAARREAYQDEYGQYDPTTGMTEYPGNGDELVQEWVDCEEAILAAIPAHAPWTPPDDRPDGFKCLGQVGVELLRVKWNPYTHWNTANDTYHGWFTVRDSVKVRPTAFRPLSPAPEALP